MLEKKKGKGITKDEAERSRLRNTLGLSSSVAILIFSRVLDFLSAWLRAVFKCTPLISVGEDEQGNPAGSGKSKIVA